MDILLLSIYRTPHRETDPKPMENPETYSDQIVAFFECLSIINNYLYPSHLGSTILRLGKSLQIHQLNARSSINRNTRASTNSGLLAILDQLMGRSDLLPQLKACLWVLYWQTHEPTEPLVTTFLVESRTWSENQSLLSFWQIWSGRIRPLLTLTLENRMNADQHTIALHQLYLNTFEEISLSEQISAALQKGLGKLSLEEKLVTVLSSHYTTQHFPELASIAEKYGLDSKRLINMNTALSMSANLKLPSAVLQGIFSNIEKSITQLQEPQIQWWPLFDCQWELDHETIKQGMQLLRILIASRSQQPPTILQITVSLFLKLLSVDATPLLLAPAILTYLADESYMRDIPMWLLVDVVPDIPEEHLMRLANFTNHEDAKVQQGALTLWANLLEDISDRPYSTPRQSSKLKILSFDWKLGLSLIKDTDASQRKKGIILLIYSHFPIRETKYLTELQSTMAQAQDSDEIAAWMLFLRNVPVNRHEKKAWLKLLETLLDAPQIYSSRILTAAMERYTVLEGVAGPEIKNEYELGLPVLSSSKRGRTRR